MKKSSKMVTIVALLMLFLLSINHIFYYYSAKNALLSSNQERMELVSRHILYMIEYSQQVANHSENLMADSLRMAAIAAKLKLPRKLEDVTNEQLIELTHELGISHLTLFQRVGNSIKGLRSSNPMERNLSTDNFAFWLKAFQQLFESHNVTIDEGYRKPNYWSGPLDVTSSDPSQLNKLGYYYDGTTDYMINAYYRERYLESHHAVVDNDKYITRMRTENPFLVEITGYNPTRFGKPPVILRQNNWDINPYPERPIYFGERRFVAKDDERYVRQAYEEKKTVHVQLKLNEKKVLKSFIPTEASFPLVLGIVSDYEVIQHKLDEEIRKIIIDLGTSALVSFAVVLLVYRKLIKSKLLVVASAEKMYLDNLNSLYTTIHGLKHDFLNIVNVIHTYVRQGRYEELKQVSEALVGEVVEIQEMIKTGDPTLAAIVQFALSQSIARKVNFEHDIASIQLLRQEGEKSLDLIRISTNLLTNAFDETTQLPIEQRSVRISIWVKESWLYFKVFNTGRILESEELPELIREGFTRKPSRQGLGLHVVSQLLVKHKGMLWVEKPSSDGVKGTTFAFKMKFSSQDGES
ncbi:sensor histidine kinase [Paenibacillus arenosi]|uniref:GHKL domain-containing protein n=1 Tax=Paenibacillus arenosi TaxID=2774142 RepID=A0ABR9ART0_9BACL|nr:ATP-binding protein [Paenibacillus arenosi]MBD8496815.1 GHKL domain-containing protein [Paenibacillus arenosi]